MKKILLPFLLLISLPTLAYDMTLEDQKIIDDLQPMIQVIQDDDPVRFDSILGKLSLVLTTLEKDTRVFSVLEYLDETMYQMKITHEQKQDEIVEIDFDELEIEVQEAVYLEPEEEEIEHEDLLNGLDEAFGYTDDNEDDRDDADEEDDDQEEDEEEENDSDKELADLFDDLALNEER